MNTLQEVQRDERTVAVENASNRWALVVLTYGLLVDVMYRGFVHHEAAWDLMGLVIASGVICTVYQAHHRTLARRWVMKVLLLACVTGVIATMVALAL